MKSVGRNLVWSEGGREASAVARSVEAGRLRPVARGLYTSDMRSSLEVVVRAATWDVVAHYAPDGLLCDRTALEGRPGPAGEVFVVSAARVRPVELPGLRVVPREGHPALAGLDRRFMARGLSIACAGRSLLDNLNPSRSRQGVSRTVGRTGVEAWMEALLARSGGEALVAVMDEARACASLMGKHAEMAVLEQTAAELGGDPPRAGGASVLVTKPGQRRSVGRPYDVAVMDSLEGMRRHLASSPALVREEDEESDGCGRDGRQVQDFYETYFSNFIEGTEFDVEEAEGIVFDAAIPTGRPEDAHDLSGTWNLVSDVHDRALVPRTPEDFLHLLRSRHATLMQERPTTLPGDFKDVANRAGSHWFVEPALVVGTLVEAHHLVKALPGAFERAVLMMTAVACVHPFRDGNGRVGRIMMNAELSACAQRRVVVPTVSRDDYLDGLRAFSAHADPQPLFRVLSVLQGWTAQVPWNEGRVTVRRVLEAVNAFERPGASRSRDGMAHQLLMPNSSIVDAALVRRSVCLG